MNKIKRINAAVGQEYGKTLPIKIVESAAPSFDWNTVNIPRRILSLEPDILKNIVRHEYGHLFINPRDLATAETMQELARLMGFQNPHIAVNIVSDMLVDSNLIKIHGAEYMKLIEKYLLNPKDEMLEIMASFYAAYADSIGVPTLLKSGPIGMKILKIVVDPTTSEIVKVYRMLETIKPFIRNTRLPYSISSIKIVRGNEAMARKILAKNGLDPEKIKKMNRALGNLFPGFEGNFTVSSDRKEITENIMRVEALLEFSFLKLSDEFSYNTWNPEDEIRNLDILKSVENSGILIPGVTTIGRKSSEGKNVPEPGIHSIAVVLDASGSMAGEKFMYAQAAVLRLIDAARTRKIKIALIPFASKVDERYIIFPTENYDEIRELILRIVPGGGTQLAPALKVVRRMDVDYSIIISDAHIGDIRRAVNILRGMKKKIFLIGEEGGEGWLSDFVDDTYILSPEGLVIKIKEVI